MHLVPGGAGSARAGRRGRGHRRRALPLRRRRCCPRPRGAPASRRFSAPTVLEHRRRTARAGRLGRRDRRRGSRACRAQVLRRPADVEPDSTPSVLCFPSPAASSCGATTLQSVHPRTVPPSAERSAGACRGVTDLEAGARGRGERRHRCRPREIQRRTRERSPPRRSTHRPGPTPMRRYNTPLDEPLTVPPRPPRQFLDRCAWRAVPAPRLGELPPGTRRARSKHSSTLQHDVTSEDIQARGTRRLSLHPEQIKRYTTTGMEHRPGQDLEQEYARDRLAGREPSPIRERSGLTTFRMPYTPTTFAPFASISRGDLFDPQAHDADTALGRRLRRGVRERRDCGNARATFRGWSESHARRRRARCLAVRGACGIFDASTLGKIEVVGADAAEFMNRLYVNNWSSLGVGRARYGHSLPRRWSSSMTTTVWLPRLAADRFHVDHHHRQGTARACAHGKITGRPNGPISRCGSPPPPSSGP